MAEVGRPSAPRCDRVGAALPVSIAHAPVSRATRHCPRVRGSSPSCAWVLTIVCVGPHRRTWRAVRTAAATSSSARPAAIASCRRFGSASANRKGMPTITDDQQLDFLRRQVLTSRYVRGGWFSDVMPGGLDHQTEHHLFPSLPTVHLRRGRSGSPHRPAAGSGKRLRRQEPPTGEENPRPSGHVTTQPTPVGRSGVDARCLPRRSTCSHHPGPEY